MSVCHECVACIIIIIIIVCRVERTREGGHVFEILLDGHDGIKFVGRLLVSLHFGDDLADEVHLFKVDLPGLEVRRHLLDEREVRQEDACTPHPRELVSVVG
jgi:hypothetical protein